MNELPHSWVRCALGDVVDYGHAKKAEPDEIPSDAWVLELEDIEKDTSKVLTRATYAERLSKSTKNRFSRGDVLYGKLRPYLNKVVIAKQDGFCTTEIVPLRPPNGLDGRYLFYWLKHPDFMDYVINVSHGMNMPRLGTEAGKAAPFVFAPLAEQRRIADKLDTLLARVDACRDRLDRIPAMLKRFRQAILSAAINGELTRDWRKLNVGNFPVSFEESGAPAESTALPEAWKWVAVGTLASKVADGVHKKPNYVDIGIPFITVRNMTKGAGIDFSETSFVSEDDHREFCKRTRPERDDILVSKDGTLGVVRLVDTDREFSIFVSVALIKLHDKSMSRYVRIALESPEVQRQMVGVGSGLQHIHLRDLRQDVIPMPPVDEQAEIVRRVESLLAIADSVDTRLKCAIDTVSVLSSALLSKAFRGELVPQDPNDEPASVLLERIRAEKASAPAKQRGRKPRETAEAPA